MVSESPPFWWKKPNWQAYTLTPFSWLYGAVAARLMRHGQRVRVPVPVICVGNFTVGGAGKTPTVITLARAAKARGMKPGILSRGYGGSLDRTTIVDASHHRAKDVGDEPLLLAEEALTVISRRRVDGARKLVAEGADIIIMDDGFQSARLDTDYALLVLDTQRGLGNGFGVPAGPVRVPLKEQVLHVTALLKVGNGVAADAIVRRLARAGKPIYEALIAPRRANALQGQAVLAFAGIADPAKFFRTVRDLDAEIVETRSYGDHQHLTEDQIDDLLQTAANRRLVLVTTAKDFVRLKDHHGRAAELAQASTVIDVDMVFDAPAVPAQIIDQAISTFKRKMLVLRESAKTKAP
jgi:tetraacyldisaccharide 4'-kinase